MQMQADLLDVCVERPAMRETTALGAAWAAGVGAGLWSADSDEMMRGMEVTLFPPGESRESREARERGWARAVERSLMLAQQP